MTTAPEPGAPDDRRDETAPTAPEPIPAEPAAAAPPDAATDSVVPQPTVPEPTLVEPAAAGDRAAPDGSAEGAPDAQDKTAAGTAPGPDPSPRPGPAASQDGPSTGPTSTGPTGAGPSSSWPGGFRPPPPPPGTSGYATRFGLVRPSRDKYIAGVCGAFGRATNTDPVLWRVALPVLTVLGGFGILMYLLGWLLIPAEGDSGSPFEALIGRGWSSTSRVLTLVLTVIAGGWLLGAVVGGITGKVVVFAAIIGIVVLVANSRGNAPWQRRPDGSVWGQATNGPAAQPWWSAGMGTYTAAPHTETVTDTPDWTPGQASAGPAATGTGWPDATTVAPGLSGGAPGTTSPIDPTLTRPGAVPFDSGTGSPVSAAYRPPFAPGGPFATSRLDYGDSPPYQESFPGLQTAPPAAPPVRPPRRRSGVTRVTLSLTLIVVGVLAVLDKSHTVNITAPAYFAAALATMGLSLMVGSLFGRSRAPIWLGILLVLGLLSSSAVREYRGNEVFTPTTMAAFDNSYDAQFANLTLDLRKLNFTGQNRTVHVNLAAGRILVQLPPDVDATVTATIGAGDTRLFNVEHSGTSVRQHVINNGSDGPGGGKITINADIRFVGEVEVVR